MQNMSYCRFENTLNALQECLDALYESSIEDIEENASQYEKPCISKLISLCTKISNEFDKEEIND